MFRPWHQQTSAVQKSQGYKEMKSENTKAGHQSPVHPEAPSRRCHAGELVSGMTTSTKRQVRSGMNVIMSTLSPTSFYRYVPRFYNSVPLICSYYYIKEETTLGLCHSKCEYVGLVLQEWQLLYSLEYQNHYGPLLGPQGVQSPQFCN